MTVPRHILKIGGSCLQQPDLPRQLDHWLWRQPPAQWWILVGGGRAIDAMRELDRLHGLQTAAMHWRCVTMLRATFEIAAELLPDFRTVATRDEFVDLVAQPATQGPWLIAVDTFYDVAHAEVSGLPQNWETTTDAIAYWLLRTVGGDQLVLAKSCPLPEVDLTEYARCEIVDAALPRVVAPGTTIRLVNLSTGDDWAPEI